MNRFERVDLKKKCLELQKNSIGPQMDAYEYYLLALEMKGNRVLVFGTGRDSTLYRKVATQVTFLENLTAWIQEGEEDIVKVDYTTLLPQSSSLLEEFHNGVYENLKMDLPDFVRKDVYDVILVDSPEGYRDDKPGRMQSIFTAWELATENTMVFVHDCNRTVENEWFINLFNPVVKCNKLWGGYKKTF